MTFQIPQDADNPIEYSMFWKLWRDEKFFDCHEVLELLWKRMTTRERWFFNGLIHGAVAIYQHRRGNSYGACRQLWRARVKLLAFAPQHNGLAIEEFLRCIESEIAPSLAALSNSQRAQQDVLTTQIKARMARDFSKSSALDF